MKLFLMKNHMYQTTEVTMTNYFSKIKNKPEKPYNPIRAGPGFEF